jgi:cysteine-rich repeat protein
LCGDGFVNVHGPGYQEECDDGNTDNGDGCLNNCNVAICGDGWVYVGVEECDDGNQTSGDGCDWCELEP